MEGGRVNHHVGNVPPTRHFICFSSIFRNLRIGHQSFSKQTQPGMAPPDSRVGDEHGQKKMSTDQSVEKETHRCPDLETHSNFSAIDGSNLDPECCPSRQHYSQVSESIPQLLEYFLTIVSVRNPMILKPPWPAQLLELLPSSALTK
jgi:hypothetical protein